MKSIRVSVVVWRKQLQKKLQLLQAILKFYVFLIYHKWLQWQISII